MERRPSRISQILIQPLVTMGRKISGKRAVEEEDTAARDPFLDHSLKIPQDFISEMKEAFRYFDKVPRVLLPISPSLFRCPTISCFHYVRESFIKSYFFGEHEGWRISECSSHVFHPSSIFLVSPPFTLSSCWTPPSSPERVWVPEREGDADPAEGARLEPHRDRGGQSRN